MSWGRVFCSKCAVEVYQDGWKMPDGSVSREWKAGCKHNWVHVGIGSKICQNATADYPRVEP